jgi:hypothetical protein
MWAFPLAATLVATAFAGFLGRRYVTRRRSHHLAFALALAMYAAAALAVVLGGIGGWTAAEFRVYWALGAVLNVPFLAAGEVLLLVRDRTARAAVWLVLVFLTAYTVSVVRVASVDVAALAADLPSGSEVFGDGSAADRLPRLIAIPSYLVLVGGAILSAWRVRSRPDLRDRFVGTLLIVAGATVIAGFGSAFAASGAAAAFSISLTAGIVVMFAGFLRAGRPTPSPVALDGPQVP